MKHKATTLECYNCGIALVKDSNHVEHIPPQCLFTGFEPIFKENRMTVPCCKKCNNEMGVFDEEFRNLIGATSNSSQNDQITSKTARALLRNKTKAANNITFTANAMLLTLPRDKIEGFLKKIFKGLFYNEYQKRLPDQYGICTEDINDEKFPNNLLEFVNWLSNSCEHKVSGHAHVFKYSIQSLPQLDNTVVAIVTFNQTQSYLLMAVKQK